ncbi:MAG: hypothetical protein WCG10_07770 [Chlamydiota bacterium]
MVYLIFIFFTLWRQLIWGSEFAINVKREGSGKIERVQFFAERCSGSNYVEALFKENTFLQECFAYGWKHFPAWIDMSSIKNEQEDLSDFFTLGHSENCLFIIVFRNPYDWIRSLYLAPHHSAKNLRKINFTKFVRTPWKLDEKDPTTQAEKTKNFLVDKNPRTSKNFKNALRLRSAKIQTLLNLKRHVSNVYYINYESFRDHPKEVLQEISEIFDIKTKEPFVDIKEYKGDKSLGKYKQKKYNHLFMNDLFYINGELDRKLERQINYELKWLYVD